MKNRREFIQSGLVITATTYIAGSAVAVPGAAEASGPCIRNSLVIYDRQFADCRAFAVTAQSLGQRLHAIAGDVTALWYEHLHPLWKNPATSIAGMTGLSALFCLEQLGRMSERRVVFRMRHDRDAGSGVWHTLFGPWDAPPERLSTPRGRDWPQQMARQIARIPWDARAVRADSSHAADGEADPGPVRSATPSASADDWHEPLVSWVLAPRRPQDRWIQESSHAAARS